MSGHSKWSTIKRAKGANDQKRGAIFTKLANAIAIAVKEGGGDINFNFKLRLAVEKAREANMPKDNIQRAIDKGLGQGGSGSLSEAMFEGFAPGGIAVIVEAITDNTNRTAGELRAIFSKNGGSLGSTGSVSYLFERVGEIVVSVDLLEKAIDAGAVDYEEDGPQINIFTNVSDLHKVKESLGAKVAEIVYRPKKETMVKVSEPGQKEKLEEFLNMLEDLDDVQKVFANVEFENGVRTSKD
jgi:YebC/PmpR family DNA-binding regulatory protein